MDKADITEGILRRVTTRDRACEITGDFLETHSHAGAISFWLAFARLFLSFIWRPSVAFLVAAIVGFCFWVEISFIAATRLFFGQIHSPILLIHAMWYAEVSASLWVLAVFTLLRFGVRDRLWVMGLVYACLTTGFIYSLWMPQSRPMLWVGLGATVVLSLSTDKLRRAFSVIVSALAIGLVIGSLLAFTVSRSIHHHLVPVSLNISLSLFLILVAPLAESITCVALHRRMIAVKEPVAR